MPLSDLRIRQTKLDPEASRPIRLFDGQGLYIELTPSGSKLWRFKYRFDGREKRLALGVYPQVGLKEARSRRDEAKSLLAGGIDPSAVRQQKRREQAARTRLDEVTFESAAAEWFATKGKNLSPRYRQEKWRRVEKYLLPHLGAIPFSRLRLLDLIRTHLLLRDTPELCRRVAQLTGQICRFAQVMQYVDSDISAGLVEVLPDKPPIRHRAAILEPAEFAALLKLIDGYRGYAVVRLALMIMANVFCRSSELVGARWEELDFEKDLWTIPAERMKRRRKHLIPLSRQVRELFQCLRSLDSETEYCFPSTLRKNCHITSEALLGALLRMGYTRDEISVHGFRSTASTILNTMKFRPDAIELQLAHVERNSVRAAYNRSDLLEERRQMLQFWSDYLDELRSS